MQPCVGIDVSSEYFHAAIYTAQGKVACKRFDNTLNGVQSLIQWCEKHGVPLQQVWFVVEDTGVYSATVCYGLHERGLRVALLSPLQVRDGFRARKTDEVDAARLAEYGYRFADRLVAWEPPRDVVVRLGHLLQARAQLRDAWQRLHNLSESMCRHPRHDASLVQQLAEQVGQLQRKQSELEEQIRQLIAADAELSVRREQVCSVRGCGEGMFWQLAMVTDGFVDIPSGRCLASWAGVCPHERRSGRRVYKGVHSRGYGNEEFLRVLHMAALAAIRLSGELRSYYLRKVSEGKPKMLVLNNVKNKLLHRLAACLRDGRCYVSEYMPAVGG